MRPESSNKILNAAKTNAFLVTNLINIRYLTGFQVSSGIVLVTKSSIALYVDSRYLEAAEKSVYKNISVKPRENIKTALNRIKNCGVEADTMTIREYGKWKRKNKNTKFVQTEEVIQEFRKTKTPEELRKFKRAQSITRKIIESIPSMLKQGTTELEIAERIRRMAVDLGAEGLSFDPIVAFEANSSRPHHHPSNKKWKKGMMLQIDIGAKYKGYCADQSAVFFSKKKTKKQESTYKAVLEAKNKATKLVCSGASTHNLYQIACEVLNKYGMKDNFTHALGHGVGLEIHEGSSLTDKIPEAFLESGEIVTIEPGVYFPGEFGIRLEDEVIVK
ncbi:aminopeptidase P family protein [Candidatus Peregrinibacteria bacterium]|nr:aminopeptidase P family protein [Candidatus Peregrinibacteria bacterium]MBT4585792.1 aminopeptidase P family protein [Candidatus Peregrinibacteria bacterium]